MVSSDAAAGAEISGLSSGLVIVDIFSLSHDSPAIRMVRGCEYYEFAKPFSSALPHSNMNFADPIFPD
jgi:hypothetical protein